MSLEPRNMHFTVRDYSDLQWSIIFVVNLVILIKLGFLLISWLNEIIRLSASRLSNWLDYVKDKFVWILMLVNLIWF